VTNLETKRQNSRAW